MTFVQEMLFFDATNVSPAYAHLQETDSGQHWIIIQGTTQITDAAINAAGRRYCKLHIIAIAGHVHTAATCSQLATEYAGPVPWPTPPGSYIHGGHLRAAEHIYQHVDIPLNASVQIAGHSLGAGVAAAFHAYLRCYREDLTIVACIGFGPAASMSGPLALSMHTCISVSHKEDPIPWLTARVLMLMAADSYSAPIDRLWDQLTRSRGHFHNVQYGEWFTQLIQREHFLNMHRHAPQLFPAGRIYQLSGNRTEASSLVSQSPNDTVPVELAFSFGTWCQPRVPGDSSWVTAHNMSMYNRHMLRLPRDKPQPLLTIISLPADAAVSAAVCASVLAPYCINLLYPFC